MEKKNTVLRADAPLFVPSFGLAPMEASKGKRRRRRRRKEKASSMTKVELPPQRNYQEQRNHGKIKDNDRLEQQCRTQSRRSNNRSRRGRTKGKVLALEETHEEGEACHILPLTEKSSFPSLSASISEKINVSQTWLNSKQAPQLFQPPKTDTAENKHGDENDHFSSMGLQLLTSQNSNVKKESSLPPEVVDGEESNADSRNNVEIYGSETINDSHPISFCSRSAKKNMEKLRDKWWEALAQRTRRNKLLAQLKRELEDRRIKDDSNDHEEMASSEKPFPLSSSFSEESGQGDDVSSECSDVQSETRISALQNLMDSICRDGATFACKDVLSRSIEMNDNEALDQMLRIWSDNKESLQEIPNNFPRRWDSEIADLLEETMFLTVKYDGPSLLKIALSHDKFTEISYSGRKMKLESAKRESRRLRPLMLAAESGYDECFWLLLPKQSNQGHVLTLLSSTDVHGNNLFHFCCRGKGDELILRELLKLASSGFLKGKQQQHSKLLLARNESLQTPLHIACERGRITFVETFLTTCSSSLLSKLLVIEDNLGQTPLLAAVAANATDVVMALTMWRGNHSLLLHRTPQVRRGFDMSIKDSSQSKSSQCPLVWAAKHGNLDIMLLLLQFCDPTSSDYRITDAISVMLHAEVPQGVKLEGIKVLVEEGGNPFCEAMPLNGIGVQETAISTACKCGSTVILRELIKSGKRKLKNRQHKRRKDPKLLLQPETFFEGMERKENLEMKRAMQNALVESLFRGWDNSKSSASETSRHLASAVELYDQGAMLESSDRARLRTSFRDGKLYSEALASTETEFQCFLAAYQHSVGPTNDISEISDLNRSPLSLASKLLCQMSWMSQDMDRSVCHCPWLVDNWRHSDVQNQNSSHRDRVVLITDDGTRFQVHDSIVSRKSAKLASAIRFARMNESTHNNKSPEVRVAISSDLCKLMLQHIYHGSVSFGWGGGKEYHCRDILELMLAAEEYLCTSLIQECEMRLLSADPTRCYCWSCAKSVRSISANESIAECMYIVKGTGKLLAGDSALDVLAVVEHLQSIDLDLRYEISDIPLPLSSITCMNSAMAWFNRLERWRAKKAVSSVKDAAIATILTKFQDVVKSGSFQESSELNEVSQVDEQESQLSQKALLLQLCLEEFARVDPSPKQVCGTAKDVTFCNKSF